MANSKSNSLYSDVAYAYWNDICDIEPLSDSEQKRLMGLIKAGDADARDAFIESFLRLVVSRAKLYSRDFDFFMDLVQEGNIGLIAAIEHFDPSKGVSFSTYAVPWIDRYIRRESCRTGRPIRIPEALCQTANNLLATEKTFEQAHGRKPTISELSEIMNLEAKKIVELRSILMSPVSLQQETNSESSTPISQKIADPDVPSPEDLFFAQSTKENLVAFMCQHLSPTEFKILQLRFGFNNDEPKTLPAIAAEFNVSKEAIRKAEARAIKKLRAAITESGLTKVDFV